MKKLNKISTALVLSLVSAATFAHEGHDHNHWTSDTIHTVFYVSLFVVAAIASIALVKRLSTKINKDANQ